MPYADPANRRKHAKTARDRFYQPSIMEEPRRYYVVQTLSGTVAITCNLGTDDSQWTVLAGPTILMTATAAYVKHGGLEQAFGG